MTTAPSSPGTARSALLEERSILKIKYKALLQAVEGAEDKRQEAVLESQGKTMPYLIRGSDGEYSYCWGKNLPYIIFGIVGEYSYC